MELLELTPEAYQQYTTNVKGNQHTTLDQAKRKLTRNVKLAKEVTNIFQRLIGKRVFFYGSMLIILKRGVVESTENYKGEIPHKDWQLDKAEYIRLSKEFGIKDNKFEKKHKKFNKKR